MRCLNRYWICQFNQWSHHYYQPHNYWKFTFFSMAVVTFLLSVMSQRQTLLPHLFILSLIDSVCSFCLLTANQPNFRPIFYPFWYIYTFFNVLLWYFLFYSLIRIFFLSPRIVPNFALFIYLFCFSKPVLKWFLNFNVTFSYTISDTYIHYTFDVLNTLAKCFSLYLLLLNSFRSYYMSFYFVFMVFSLIVLPALRGCIPIFLPVR